MSGPRTRDEVPLKKDPFWWLHPALRGRQAMALGAGSGADFPHRWSRTDESRPAIEANLEYEGPHADFARLLYRLNGNRPGRVRGAYIIVRVAEARFAVGQLCADPGALVVLYEDRIFDTEDEARTAATALKDGRSDDHR